MQLKAVKYISVFLCGMFITATAHAQTSDQKKTFTETVPSALKYNDSEFWTFTFENDSIGGGTDRDYTSGLRLSYFDTGADETAIADILDKILPGFEINDTTSAYYSIGQNLYTPRDITARSPDPDDRPYAAFLYGAAGFSTLVDNHIDEYELTLGVVGPGALGEETQEFVHDLLDKDDPSGWDTQLENEPGVILSWQRRWPEAYGSGFGPFHFRATPHTAISLGNVYTYGGGGMTFQLTPKDYKWQAPPQRIRPAIPGSGFFHVPDRHFAWSLFAGFEGRAMARNIFLDGNTFKDGPSVDKKPFVADANVGLSTTYGRAQISYTLNWRSKEFDGQEDESLFGAISVGYRF